MRRINYAIEIDDNFLKEIDYDASKRKYKTPDELREKINEYFRSISIAYPAYEATVDEDGNMVKEPVLNSNGEPYIRIQWLDNPKLEAMRRFLGLSESQYKLYLHDEEFADILHDAKSIIESYVEDKLYERNPTGAMFILKARFGWRDKENQTIDINIKKSLEDFFEEE
jgi:hypothetical protein